jgi:outer membrane immunogenic protein
MKKFRLALTFAASLAAQMAPSSLPASAADLGGGYKDTPYVVMPWQGLYFGVHGGGAWGSAKVNDNFDYYGDPHMDGSAKSTDAIGGAQAGYNVQQGHLVFGIEGDVGYLGLSAKGADTHTSYWGDPNCHGSDWHYCNISGKYDTSGGLYGDLTGRVGYATNRVLFYGKGGVAFLNADLKTHYDGNTVGNLYPGGTVPFDFDHSETLVGWTIGAGAEVAINPSWSIKAEYQHFDFGSMSNDYGQCKKVMNWNSAACPAGGGYGGNSGTANLKGTTDTSIAVDTVKFGLNYRINN